MQVADGDGAGGVFLAFGVGLAEGLTAAKATPGDGDTEARRPVVAATGGVDTRGAPELAAADDDCFFEQTTGLQVFQQGGKRGVENLQIRGVKRMVVGVGVPTAERHFHAAHADFDQPPCR